MYFLTPAAFALAALIPIIIVMYLLKRRRTERLVSSVYLWRRMVRDLEANAPWQRLRRNLLLLLQVLFLILLILALARPFTWTEGASGQAVILILDTSASMAATDVAPSRMEAAKAQAHRLADGLPDDARVTVIAAGDGAQVLVASSRDRRRIHQTIADLQVTNGGSDLTAALELASAIAARQPETEVIVLSDGRVTLPERLAVKGHVRYRPVGISGDNQAISTLSLGETPRVSQTLGVYAFVQVTNYGQAPARRRLALYADGQLVNAYDLEIPPRGQKAVVADDLPPDTHIVEARLTGRDALPLDDRAWAIHRRTAPAAVALVTNGNLFLETALALLPNLQVTTIRPADLEDWETGKMEDWKDGRPEDDETQPSNLPISQPPNSPTFQPPTLTILDAYVPLTVTLPPGNLLFIAPPRSTAYFTVTGTVDQPLPRPVDAADPLLAHVNLAEVSVLDAVRIPLPPWARAVIAGDVPGETVPLLFAGEVDDRRVAVLTFDLHHSDLPLQVAFPVLMANLMGWLAPGSGSDLPTQVAPGEVVVLSLPPEVASATVTLPDGSTARLVPEGGRVMFADTAQLGVYRVTWGETGQASFAVNLFSPPESDVQPAETLPVVGREEPGKGTPPQQARREWWRPLAFAALVLLMTEWLVYHRPSLTD